MKSITPSAGEILDEGSNWLVGGGILTLALFPLALPALVLITVTAIPLVLIAGATGLCVAAVVLMVRLVIRLARWAAAMHSGSEIAAVEASGAPLPGFEPGVPDRRFRTASR